MSEFFVSKDLVFPSFVLSVGHFLPLLISSQSAVDGAWFFTAPELHSRAGSARSYAAILDPPVTECSEVR